MDHQTIAQAVLQNRRIACVITNRNLQVVEICGAVDLLYSDQQEWEGRSLLDLVPELVGSEPVLADILDGKLPHFTLEWVNRDTPNGQNIYLTLVDLPYRDESGRITGLIHLVDDVSEVGILHQHLAQGRNELRLLRDRLARQNLELASANTELQQLSDMKSKFVSIAAHELRSPLTSITGFVEILLDEDDLGPLTPDQREYLEIVQTSAHRLLTITNNLLDITRIETGRIELVLQPINLGAVIETVAAEFEPQITARSQQLTLQIPPNLPPALGDETRAIQIVGNLVSNASKYTPTGGQITVSLAPAAEEGFLQVSVADTGVGIPPTARNRLFTSFFRAETASQTQASGAGLGLQITRSLVELHSGRIWFQSEPGQGSTFYVTFPIAEK